MKRKRKLHSLYTKAAAVFLVRHLGFSTRAAARYLGIPCAVHNWVNGQRRGQNGIGCGRIPWVNTIVRPGLLLITHASKTFSVFYSLEDADIVEPWTWRIRQDGYVKRECRVRGRAIQLLMHREVAERMPGCAVRGEPVHVHHINKSLLDNRRENLYVCTPDEHKKLHYLV